MRVLERKRRRVERLSEHGLLVDHRESASGHVNLERNSLRGRDVVFERQNLERFRDSRSIAVHVRESLGFNSHERGGFRDRERGELADTVRAVHGKRQCDDRGAHIRHAACEAWGFFSRSSFGVLKAEPARVEGFAVDNLVKRHHHHAIVHVQVVR